MASLRPRGRGGKLPPMTLNSDRMMNDLFRSLKQGLSDRGMTLTKYNRTDNGFSASLGYRSASVSFVFERFGKDLYYTISDGMPQEVAESDLNTIGPGSVLKIVEGTARIMDGMSEGRVQPSLPVIAGNKGMRNSELSVWLDGMKLMLSETEFDETVNLSDFDVNRYPFSVRLIFGKKTIYVSVQYEKMWTLHFTSGNQHVTWKSSALDDNLKENVVSILKFYLSESGLSFEYVLLRLMDAITGHLKEPINPAVISIIQDMADLLRNRSP